MSKTRTETASTSNAVMMKGKYHEESDSDDDEDIQIGSGLRVSDSYTTVREMYIGSDDEDDGETEEPETEGQTVPEACGRCSEKIQKKDDAIECETCKQPFHITCENVTKTQYKQHLANKRGKNAGLFHFSCATCSRVTVNMMRQMAFLTAQLHDMGKKVDHMESRKADKKELKKLDEEMKAGVAKVKEEVTQMKDDVTIVKEKVKLMEGREGTSEGSTRDIIKEIQDREERRNNVVIFNLPESRSHDPEERVRFDKEEIREIGKICQVNIKKDEMTKVIRMGKNGKDTRPLLLKFTSEEKKRLLLKNAEKLNSSRLSRIGIQQDLTTKQREEEKALKDEADRMTQELSDEEQGEYKYAVRGPPWARKVKKIRRKKPQIARH